MLKIQGNPFSYRTPMTANSTNTVNLLPRPRLVAEEWHPQNGHLICAAGFEDRATAFIITMGQFNFPINVSLVRYLPFAVKNEATNERIQELVNATGGKKSDYLFDRENPLEFALAAREIISRIPVDEHIYLDISAMSKLLELYLLRELWNEDRRFSIVYAEAAEYGPSKTEFDDALRQGAFGQNLLMEFLFNGVYEPLIPPEFAGKSALGAPRLLLAFLGYNKRQTIGAASVVPYQLMIPLIGIPEQNEWAWRREAVMKINDEGLLTSGRKISELPLIEVDRIAEHFADDEFACSVSILDYTKVLATLINLKELHRYSHFLTIAPFGSKLQTLAIFIFSRLNPDVQIVYASPRDFHPQYSKGVKNIWEIVFENPLHLEHQLMVASDPGIAEIERLAAI